MVNKTLSMTEAPIDQGIGNTCWQTIKPRGGLEMQGKDTNVLNMQVIVLFAFVLSTCVI